MSGPPGAGRTDLAGAGLIVLAAAGFGTLGPLSRFANEAGVDSLTLVTWRAAIGAAVVATFIGLRLVALGARPRGPGSIPSRDRWFLVATAGANAVLNLTAFLAFERITIALTLLVFYLYPAGVAVASTIWFGERLDRLRWAALGVSLLGMALVVAGAGAIGELDGVGVGLAFVAALAQVFSVLAARHGFARVPGPQAAVVLMGGAALLYVGLGALLGNLGAIGSPAASTDAAVPVLLAGIVGAGVPTVSFILGIRRLGAPRAAILATLEPIIGVGLAALLLAEQPAPIQIVGGAFVLVAAVMLQVAPNAPVGDHEAVAEADAVTERPEV